MHTEHRAVEDKVGVRLGLVAGTLKAKLRHVDGIRGVRGCPGGCRSRVGTGSGWYHRNPPSRSAGWLGSREAQETVSRRKAVASWGQKGMRPLHPCMCTVPNTLHPHQERSPAQVALSAVISQKERADREVTRDKGIPLH